MMGSRPGGPRVGSQESVRLVPVSETLNDNGHFVQNWATSTALVILLFFLKPPWAAPCQCRPGSSQSHLQRWSSNLDDLAL
jgi:hypothetical protein